MSTYAEKRDRLQAELAAAPPGMGFGLAKTTSNLFRDRAPKAQPRIDLKHFDGVLTFSESAVMAVATVADALGLAGVGVQTARTSRNKFLMRQAHERAGIPRPRFRLVQSWSDVPQ